MHWQAATLGRRETCDRTMRTAPPFLNVPTWIASIVLVVGMISVQTLASPPEQVGGSNFAWYAMDGCDRSRYGAIEKYDRNKSQIDSVLRQMFLNGQRRLRLPVLFSDGSSDPSVLKIGIGGLSNQDRDKFAALVASISRIGFEEVQVALFPFDPNWAGNWKEWQEDRYRENWVVIIQLRQIMDASGMRYNLDLQNEGVPFPFQTMLKQYVHRVWRDYTGAYGPTRTIGVSGQPKPGRVAEIPQIYDGTLPEALDFHLGADAGRDLLMIDSTLRSLGLANIPLIVGEALYNDATEAAELAEAARTIPRRVLYLSQWPQTRVPGCPDVSVVPLQFNAYRAKGF